MIIKVLNKLLGNGESLNPESSTDSGLSKILDKLIKEVAVPGHSWYSDAPVADCESFKEVKALDADQKAEFIWLVAKTLYRVSKEEPKYVAVVNYFKEAHQSESAIITKAVCKTLQKLLLKDKYPMTEAVFCDLVLYYNNHFDIASWYSGHPVNELLYRARLILNGLPPSEKMRSALLSMIINEDGYINKEVKKRNQKIQMLLDGGLGLAVDKNDFLGLRIIQYYESLPDEKKSQWEALVKVCYSEGGKSAPSTKWLKEIKHLKEGMIDELSSCLMEWISLCHSKLQEIHKQGGYEINYLRDANIAIFKGFLWCCPTPGSLPLQQAVADYVLLAYKKKSGVGSISVATGTAGLWNLSQLPVKEGIPRLLAVRNKVSNNIILKSIDKLLREAAEKNNLFPQELEEIACPDYGMQAVGFWEMELGEFKIIINESKFQGVLHYEKAGKEVNSIPAGLKAKYQDELKNAKILQKNISEQIRTHCNRLENAFLHNRTWRFDNWKELYIDHPLMAIIGRKIIWHFSTVSEKYEAIYHKGKLVQVSGEDLPLLPKDAMVFLWHPIGFDSSYIFQWRQWLRNHEIQQPFKQAFREVYLLTDAELKTDTYSNRFAAHIIRQHQFNALAKLRGWSYQRMGQWDSHNHPMRFLPWLDMHVEWFVDADWNGEASEGGIFNYIMTDQVRFYKNGVLLHLYDVPALVFSELMRDVDMFVGVCSIGNDQSWQDGGNAVVNSYWRNFSFSDTLSESAEIRMETLQHLIPKMKIASQCSFDKKFLIVKGKLRTYKIHMGSGNILMEPNDQYLCIVPDSKPSGVERNLFIPFEGDRMLSIIISKALLLADDHKISDITITRQIG